MIAIANDLPVSAGADVRIDLRHHAVERRLRRRRAQRRYQMSPLKMARIDAIEPGRHKILRGGADRSSESCVHQEKATMQTVSARATPKARSRATGNGRAEKSEIARRHRSD